MAYLSESRSSYLEFGRKPTAIPRSSLSLLPGALTEQRSALTNACPVS